ncbi:MAG: penicillin-binding protein 2 [Candidatus Omnitrophota bacterium]|nr:MAG: penicillin-binding protein 2 [Candidatus Omnitrophota bacterium]
MVLVISLFYYQALKGNYFLKRAEHNYVRAIPIRSLRGSILDRNSVLLAYDKASFNIAVIPHQIRKKKDILFKQLAEFLSYDEKIIQANYKRSFSNLFSPVDVIIDIDKAQALEAKEYFSGDILINPQPQRHYNFSYECAHILGYVKEAASFYENLKKYGYAPNERAGFSGIEQYYDAYLKGEDGGDLIEVDSSGKIVGFLGERKAFGGEDIKLTIDSRIQEIAYKALEGRRGTLILMDAQSGEVLALISSPSFDSNAFVRGKNVARFLMDKKRPLLNRAIQSSYPLGSTFKPIVAAAALEEGRSAPEKKFTCRGRLTLGRATFECWATHGPDDLYEAFAHSCNVYFYNLGMVTGPEFIGKWAQKFGLNVATGIDLPYERKGFVPTPEWKRKRLKTAWYGGDTLNLSIGQGFLEATPLEALVAINAIATDGYLVKPYLIKEMNKVEASAITKSFVGISKESIDEIKHGLRAAVEFSDGTAYELNRLNLEIAGKTGTAQTKGLSHGWFVGFFPYAKPKYAFCVFAENCGSSSVAVDISYQFLRWLQNKNLIEK